ncbi:hypothetical protein CASFOL_001445 [Castilleja foliolosa]|uniref:Uncharacterized protein n=1 Tax=Castilleja foliolosa TaxID=1961234 RepID=A0ABD3EKB4_9LAMI
MKAMVEQMMADLKGLDEANEKGNDKVPDPNIHVSHENTPLDHFNEKGDDPKNAEKPEKNASPALSSMGIDGSNPSIPIDTASERTPVFSSMGIDGFNPSIPIDIPSEQLPGKSSMEIDGSNPSIPIDSTQNRLHRAENRYVPGSLKGTIPNKDVKKGKESAENTRGPVVMKEDDPDPIEEEALDMEISQLVECEKPIAPEPELKVDLTPLPEPSQCSLTSVDEIKFIFAKLADEEVRDNVRIRSSEKKVDMLHERYREYMPQFYRIYEEHDRGPTNSSNSKFLEPHSGLNKILRLTKRHVDAILDKRIIKEDWGASLSSTLPSSFCFEFCLLFILYLFIFYFMSFYFVGMLMCLLSAYENGTFALTMDFHEGSAMSCGQVSQFRKTIVPQLCLRDVFIYLPSYFYL